MTKLCLISVIDEQSEIESFMPPLGLGYIAAYLKKYLNFNKIKIIDEDIEKNVYHYKPDIVGMSSVSQNFNKTVTIAKKIKSEFDIPIIMGGIHISALPHTLEDCFDIAVVGEGEQTMLDLMDLYEEKGFNNTYLDRIKGIAFQDNNRIRTTEKRELIEPLDNIPFPARELLKITDHTSMFTSRGCPYRCIFCASSNFWGNSRYFSAEYVVNEIKELVDKYSVRMIDFWDDLFIGDKKRLHKISQMIKEDGIGDKVVFICQGRTNLIDDNVLTDLKNMNVKQISFGFESGSQYVLDYLKKRTVTVQQNKKAIYLCKKNGINVNGSFILGSPEETIEDAQKSLNFLENSNIDSGSIYMLTPYPGTELWEYAKKQNVVDDSMNWNKLNVEDSEIIKDFKSGDINVDKKYIYLNKNISLEEISDIYIKIQKEFETRRFKLHLSIQAEQITTNEKEIIKLQNDVITLNIFMNNIIKLRLYKIFKYSHHLFVKLLKPLLGGDENQ